MAIRPAQSKPVGLQELFPQAERDVAITGATLDSRDVAPGWLYAALPGARTHGAKFATQAIAAGAAAILTDAEGRRLVGDVDVPVVAVDDVRAVLGETASRVFGDPTSKLKMFGVTGTNGKTTTVSLLAAALRGTGSRVGTIGTIGFHLDGEELESDRTTVTTPEAIDLQALFAVMAERGADAVALEVSSHALEFQRVGGISFDAVGFLNLGHDHLDFHGTVEHYAAAKAKLFEPGRSKAAVFWVDDAYGRELSERTREHTKTITVGTTDADYILGAVRPYGRLGGVATVTRGGEELELRLSLPGKPNMIDGAIALAMLESAGMPTKQALAALEVAQVPGRMQQAILEEDAPLVIVDFAHTPQAVSGAVESLSKFGPVTTVLGCGGDRDAEKRPVMGRAAALGSDLVIVTDDNPRTEEPAVIREAVRLGAEGHGAEVVEVDGRAKAIELALERTPKHGVVAILGKGHERGQILADRVVEFDDVEVVRRTWGRMKEGTR